MKTPDQTQPVWSGAGDAQLSLPQQENVIFCAGRDVARLPMADELLIPYDIWTNRAHALMLAERGLISSELLAGIMRGLKAVEARHAEGEFELNPEHEDVHMNIEAAVTESEGVEVGGWMHIGRSRNDQAACDLRLYLRDVALKSLREISALIDAILALAAEHTETVMPGFTHYQPGMITTWGHWLCSYAQALTRDQERFLQALKMIDRSPLGAAASFGTSWPIDREFSADLLGFGRVEINSLDCITARWECESELAHAISMHMNHLSIIAQDMIMLSLPYVRGIEIDRAFVTGSSIMPQKRNPDFAEVIKSKAALAHGNLMSLLGIQKGGLSGYNRDTQLTKYLIMDIVRECQPAAAIMRGVFSTLTVERDRLRELCEVGFMNAVDIADWLAREHKLPFRSCYRVLGDAVKRAQAEGYELLTYEALSGALTRAGIEIEISPDDLAELNDPDRLIARRQHTGAPSPQQVTAQREALSKLKSEHDRDAQAIEARIAEARARCIARSADAIN